MRTSLGQYRQLLAHFHGFVSTVTVATPEAVRPGFICSVRTRRRSSSSSTFQEAQRAGSLRFVSR